MIKKELKYVAFIAIYISIFLPSCFNSKQVYYMRGIKDSVYKNIPSTPSVIERGDQLYIFVSSLNVESASIFNMPNFLSASTNSQSGQTQNNPVVGYLVDESGKIVMNKIGAIQASGLTYKQLKDTIEQKLSTYLKDPIVNIRLINFRITVLGEVAHPGTFNAPNTDLNILQGLGLAGDLLITGKRKNVLLYRQTDTAKITYRINLTDTNLISHPAFNLKSGDVLYVEPNRVKMNASSSFLQIWPTIVSAATLLVVLLTTLKK